MQSACICRGLMEKYRQRVRCSLIWIIAYPSDMMSKALSLSLLLLPSYSPNSSGSMSSRKSTKILGFSLLKDFITESQHKEDVHRRRTKRRIGHATYSEIITECIYNQIKSCQIRPTYLEQLVGAFIRPAYASLSSVLLSMQNGQHRSSASECRFRQHRGCVGEELVHGCGHSFMPPCRANGYY